MPTLTNAVKSYGTFLKIGDGATIENFTTVAELSGTIGIKMSAKQEDVSTHNQGDAVRQYISTLIDGGTIPLDVNFIPTEITHSFTAGVLKDFWNRTRRNYQIVWPDGFNTTWTAPCNVSDADISGGIDGVIKGKFTLKVAGAPTLA